MNVKITPTGLLLIAGAGYLLWKGRDIGESVGRFVEDVATFVSPDLSGVDPVTGCHPSEFMCWESHGIENPYGGYSDSGTDAEPCIPQPGMGAC